jgi:hypothetical protein
VPSSPSPCLRLTCPADLYSIRASAIRDDSIVLKASTKLGLITPEIRTNSCSLPIANCFSPETSRVSVGHYVDDRNCHIASKDVVVGRFALATKSSRAGRFVAGQGRSMLCLASQLKPQIDPEFVVRLCLLVIRLGRSRGALGDVHRDRVADKTRPAILKQRTPRTWPDKWRHCCTSLETGRWTCGHRLMHIGRRHGRSNLRSPKTQRAAKAYFMTSPHKLSQAAQAWHPRSTRLSNSAHKRAASGSSSPTPPPHSRWRFPRNPD